MSSLACMWMRGGTSKGGYFIAGDLPENKVARDAILLSIMGSPDPRQIDGMGGADPLTSKVAIVSASSRDDADVEYLFLQVLVDQAVVTDAQNCGNILAGVAPFAIERGIISAKNGSTRVRIYMQNTGKIAVSTVQTPKGKVTYQGVAVIDGVSGSAAPISLEFTDIAGSSCGALLPTGNPCDLIENTEVTCIDNGMPCVVISGADLGVSGRESREELESNEGLRDRLEAIRLKAGLLMKLGNVANKTVPKMSIVSRPTNGGTISTRTFIPHRCHASIGVLGAVSVATACLVKGSTAFDLAVICDKRPKELKIEHPIGQTTVIAELDDDGNVHAAGVLRTARKLFDGQIFAHAGVS